MLKFIIFHALVSVAAWRYPGPPFGPLSGYLLSGGSVYLPFVVPAY